MIKDRVRVQVRVRVRDRVWVEFVIQLKLVFGL